MWGSWLSPWPCNGKKTEKGQVRLHGLTGGVFVDHLPPGPRWSPAMLQAIQTLANRCSTHTHTNTNTNTNTQTHKHTNTKTQTQRHNHKDKDKDKDKDKHKHTNKHTNTHTHTYLLTHTHTHLGIHRAGTHLLFIKHSLMYLESMKLSGVPGPIGTQGCFQSSAFCLCCTWQRNSSDMKAYHSKSGRSLLGSAIQKCSLPPCKVESTGSS